MKQHKANMMKALRQLTTEELNRLMNTKRKVVMTGKTSESYTTGTNNDFTHTIGDPLFTGIGASNVEKSSGSTIRRTNGKIVMRNAAYKTAMKNMTLADVINAAGRIVKDRSRNRTKSK